MKDPSGAARVRKIIDTVDFLGADSSSRITQAIRAASSAADKVTTEPAEEIVDFAVGDRVFGRMKSNSAGTTVSIPKQERAFARWLADRMPDLLSEYNNRSDPTHQEV